MNSNILKQVADTIRALSADGVEKAKSGHPGLPLGMADVATVLFSQYLKFNPKNPNWFNRDRFVLSGGHGSMLLYSLLHLYGYDLSISDLKQFRQWHSKTPGHPELQDTPGVETTTGPLGQGISNAVGMALAETILAAKFNTDKHKIIDHHTYVFAGDGDLQEGISHEACSFAGHNKLGKLILLYDSNQITIDGKTSLSFSDNTEKRFESYGWQVLRADGHNFAAIDTAIKTAKSKTEKPSIIICKTVIGYGSPNKQGSESVHGAPLGEEELRQTKEKLGLPDKGFHVPETVYKHTQNFAATGESHETAWVASLDKYKKEEAEKYEKLKNILSRKQPDLNFKYFKPEDGKIATRAASGKVIEQIAKQVDNLVGGSADLTPSNKTKVASQSDYSPENRAGTYIRYGVREFGMGGIMNGIALHGGLIPYGGTFFVFSDYMRSAIRMAALMQLRVVYVFTHDSIGLGEDGPTHQPVEHLASLRAMPGLTVLRPADANETSEAWKYALQKAEGPTALVLTRQGLATFDRNDKTIAPCTMLSRGAYILSEDNNYEYIIIASGSEVEIAFDAKEKLNGEGKKVRIVSMPSTELFEQQPEEYKNNVIPPDCEKIVAVEAAASQSWYKYTGKKGKIIGLDRYGASAPYQTLYEKFGITADAIVEAINSL